MRRIFAILFLSGLGSVVWAQENIWLLVDTQKLSLSINQGNKTLEVLENIAIGKRGAGFKKRVGDEVTPLGDYKIGWIDRRSAYHLFMGLNYPSSDNAEQALQQGLINQDHYQAIVTAARHDRIPPQNTPLGGKIGIHGLGRADLDIHKSMNWTRGCIALTNPQIMRLSRWVSEGTVIKIR